MVGDRIRKWFTGDSPVAKVARGSLLAFGGAAGAILLEQVLQALSHAATGGLFGPWSPLVAAVISVILNIVKQLNTPPTPAPGA